VKNQKVSFLSNIPEKLVDELNKNLNSKMLVLFGNCSSLFDGRIKSTLEPSERLLVIKKDGTIILHDSTGLKPIQWQKPKAGKINFTLTPEKFLKMETYRPKTDETFYITFHEIYMALAITTTMKSSSAFVLGDEKDFVTYLIKHPEIIENGLRILENEFKTEVGSIDILAIDKDKKHVIIEVKKAQATPADAHQLERYVDFYSKNYHKNIRGILIANNVPSQVKKHLQKTGLEYKEIPWQQIFPTLRRPNSVKKISDLTDFF